MATAEPLIEVHDLSVVYRGHARTRGAFQAVNTVSLTLPVGQTLGLVGESGSGKSTIGNAILGMVNPSAGVIRYRGEDITHASMRRRRDLTRHLQVVFQDPYSSLNPSRTIGQTLSDPLRVPGRASRAEANDRVGDVLDSVGLPANAAYRYPAEFSGGQRQRIAIARALVLEPDVIICDEPTSSLDLSIQAQILNLLQDLQDKLALSYLFISHDIGVIRHVSDDVAVLLRGHLVEHGPVDAVTNHPAHPYTQALLAATPITDPRRQRERRQARADMATQTTATLGTVGCPFASRCPNAVDICSTERPARTLTERSVQVACHLYTDHAAAIRTA
jgi:oligopeptide/dipeptide ABC transporter ATP-binding protein